MPKTPQQRDPLFRCLPPFAPQGSGALRQETRVSHFRPGRHCGILVDNLTGGPPSGTRGGCPLDYELIRSRRRTLALELTRDGRLLVRAPARCPDAVIAGFVDSHRDWIARQRIRQQQQRASAPPPQSREDIAALKLRARAVLPGKVAHYAAILGVEPQGFRVTEARTRYGSCSGKNALSFSCFLMLCPEEAIDLVVVHELCHIRHHDHSPAFYALLSSVLPDHRQRRQLLHMPQKE